MTQADVLWYIFSNKERKELGNCNLHFFIYFYVQDDLIKILGEKHQLYEFLNTLYVKCSYLIFNKEHVKAVLSEISSHKSTENDLRIPSCIDILVVRAYAV